MHTRGITVPHRISVDGVPPIKVVGVGGGGCNAINRMIEAQIRGVHFVAVNTDAQQLEFSKAPVCIRIGDRESGGLGVGGDPERGAKAAEESREELLSHFQGVDMVFIAAGMGGGTGTGAAPVIAEAAKRCGALTIAVVTRPFEFEGVKRGDVAQEGIAQIEEFADTVIVIPNQRLLDPEDANITVEQAFRKADEVLRQGIQGISDVITVPGQINLDFNDVKKVMGSGGQALMAIGRGSGEQRAVQAAEQAIRSPLLETTIEGATRVLYNISSSGGLGMLELAAAAEVIQTMAAPEAEIIMGTAVDEDLGGDVQLTVVATGFAPRDQHSKFPAMARNDWSAKLLDELDLGSASAFSTPAFLRRRDGRAAAAPAGQQHWDATGATGATGARNGRSSPAGLG